MRRPFVAGNWKMHHLAQDALRFGQTLSAATGFWHDVDVAIFPPTTLLLLLERILKGTSVRLGGQNCHHARSGAYTGEVSAVQLADTGCTMALVGHSERRRLFGDIDEVVALKLDATLDAGLRPILCIGETEDERGAGRTEEVLERQLRALAGVAPESMATVSVAYEPVWAIGTGKTATPALAQEAHAFVRAQVASLFDAETADATRILYGGSVTPDNFPDLIAQPDVDGALVGGASLDADRFLAIIAAAIPQG